MVRREQLRQRFKEAGDAGFVALLHTMDNPNIPLETKWSGIQQHLATKQEFGCAPTAYLQEVLEVYMSRPCSLLPATVVLATFR